MVLTTGPVAGLNAAALYDPATATFAATGGSTVPHGGTTATLLNNGMVLIAVQNGVQAALYNPATGTFASTGNMNMARIDAGATLLHSGMLLIAGGIFSCNVGNVCPPPSAELYDPTTGTFTLTGNPFYAHGNGTATLLNSGMVLLAGGDPQGPTQTVNLQSIELYDPTTGTFVGDPGGELNTGRVNHTATLLNNGQVLIAGGLDSTNHSLASAELYNPTTGAFTFTGSMNTARMGQTATLLNNGQVLVAGGFDSASNSLLSAELYDPTTGTFTSTGSLNAAGDGQTATLLNNGTVLLVGTGGAELYELIGLLPTSLSFSNQLINVKSTPQSVTLTNNQSTALGTPASRSAALMHPTLRKRTIVLEACRQ